MAQGLGGRDPRREGVGPRLMADVIDTSAAARFLLGLHGLGLSATPRTRRFDRRRWVDPVARGISGEPIEWTLSR